MNAELTKPTRQDKFASKLGITLDDLASKIKPIKPSTNKVTKKEIMGILNADQRRLIRFYIQDGKNTGLTIQHLDPQQNELNSVRFQMLKETGHLLRGIITETWDCALCEFTQDEPIAYYLSFGDEKTSICRDKLRRDDEKLVIGGSGVSKHMFDEHWEESVKRLGKMGVKVSKQ